MKILGPFLLFCIVALYAIACCVSAFSSKSKRSNDPGVLENIEENVDPCPLGWTQFHDYCYSVSASSTSWSQAQVYCHFLSGDLVKINSADENEFVLSLVRQQAPSVKQVWLGLQWDSTAFYWADHSVPVYKNWAPGEPNGKAKEPCAQMYTNRETQLPVRASGYWNDIPCGVDYLHPIGTVCKRLP